MSDYELIESSGRLAPEETARGVIVAALEALSAQRSRLDHPVRDDRLRWRFSGRWWAGVPLDTRRRP